MQTLKRRRWWWGRKESYGCRELKFRPASMPRTCLSNGLARLRVVSSLNSHKCAGFQGYMNKFITVLILVLLGGILAVCVAQQEILSPDLKAAALKESACTTASDTQNADAK